jgi:DNA polymerase I-like protein with 3'-5' exonuclease and polymerase domains
MDVESGEEWTFTNKHDWKAFLEANDNAIYYAHNGIGYDYPVLDTLWDAAPRAEQQYDTLVLSRLANPSRSGGHGLSNWGNILGFSKSEAPGFNRLTDELIEYCRRDVQVTARVVQQLARELAGFDRRSIKLEHEVARIIYQQEQNGWLLDERGVYILLAELKEKKIELEEAVHRRFKPRCKAVKEVTPKVKQDGTLSAVGLKWYGEGALADIAGPLTRVDWPEFNLGSRQQIGQYLIHFGWKPTRFTETGQPMVDEKTLMGIDGIPEATLIADYLTVQKRIAMAQSWLDVLGPDGRVRGRVNSNGAVTGRMTHYSPNMAQVTSGSKIYGKEMRECWTAPEGRKIVGMDASGLELRMLAHYMNDEDYTREVTDGDVHTANQNAAGLPTRDNAKTFIYAFLYGAGDAKIGSIVGGSKRDGAKLKQKFLRNTPALAALRERVQQAAKRGWLKGLDGRRIYVRSQHAALNTLLQGAGAVVMKQALMNLHREAVAAQLDFKLVGNIHDEVQAEVAEGDAVAFGEIAKQSVIDAGEQLGLRCPLDAEYKVGDSWADTH